MTKSRVLQLNAPVTKAQVRGLITGEYESIHSAKNYNNNRQQPKPREGNNSKNSKGLLVRRIRIIAKEARMLINKISNLTNTDEIRKENRKLLFTPQGKMRKGMIETRIIENRQVIRRKF